MPWTQQSKNILLNCGLEIAVENLKAYLLYLKRCGLVVCLNITGVCTSHWLHDEDSLLLYRPALSGRLDVMPHHSLQISGLEIAERCSAEHWLLAGSSSVEDEALHHCRHADMRSFITSNLEDAHENKKYWTTYLDKIWFLQNVVKLNYHNL